MFALVSGIDEGIATSGATPRSAPPHSPALRVGALRQAAASRPDPIPFYGEFGRTTCFRPT